MAEHGGTGTLHSRTAPGTIRTISANKAGLFSWRLWARRFVCSVTRRRGGPPAHRPRVAEAPDVDLRRTARDPPTKPSRGWVRVVVRKLRLVLAESRATRN